MRSDWPSWMGQSTWQRLVLLLLLFGSLAMAWLLCPDRQRGLLIRTLQLACWANCIAVPIGTLLAMLIVRTDLPCRRFFGSVLLITAAVPLYLQAAAWNAGFGQLGWWQLLAGGLGVEPLLCGFRGAALVHGLAAIPWVSLIVGADLWLAPRDAEESALLDGSKLQVAFRITLPHVLTAAMAAALWITVIVAGEITVTDLYQVRTYAEELYVGFAMDTLEGNATVAPAALGVLHGMILLVALTLGVFFVGWQVWWRRGTTIDRLPPRQFLLDLWRWPAFLFVLFALFLIVGVPLLNLLSKCGTTFEQSSEGGLRGWSLYKAASLLTASPWRFREELGWSLALSQLSSLLSLALAVPLAWWSRSRGWRVTLIAVVAAVFIAIPGPLLALAVMSMFQSTNSEWLAAAYSQSVAAPTIVLTVRTLPIVLLILSNSFSQIDDSSTEAARLAGAGIYGQLLFIVLPQRHSVLVCAWLVGIIVALGDLAASILVVPPGVTTVAIRIFGLMHYGVEDQLAAICLAMVGIIAILAGLVGFLWRPLVTMRSGFGNDS